MAGGGGQIVGGRGCGKGQGVGARRVGEGGLARGWGKGARAWNLYLNEVLNKTGIVTRLGCHNERYDTKSGNPQFWRDFPIVMTSHSRKYVIISPKKSENEMCERFHLIIYARRSSHLGKLKNWLTSNF